MYALVIELIGFCFFQCKLKGFRTNVYCCLKATVQINIRIHYTLSFILSAPGFVYRRSTQRPLRYARCLKSLTAALAVG